MSTVNGFAVHPSNAHVMYVAMREGIFHTDDGGWKWKILEKAPKNVAAVAAHPTRPNEVYSVMPDGQVFLSIDRGATWAAPR